MARFRKIQQILILLNLTFFLKVCQSFPQTLIDQNEIESSEITSNETDIDSEYVEYDINNYNELVLNKMNLSVDPCEDFAEYACGKNWIEGNINEKVMDEVIGSAYELVLEIVNSNETEPENTKVTNLVKSFYASCINTNLTHELGAKPFLEFSDRLGGCPLFNSNWSEVEFNIEEQLYQLNLYKTSPMYNTDQIFVNEEIIPMILKPTLVLGKRHYYLNTDYASHMNSYRNLIIEILQLLEVSETEAAKVAGEIVDIETKLAEIDDKTEAQSKTLKELLENYPNFNWKIYLEMTFNTTFDDDSKVSFENGENCLNETYDVIVNTDRKILANYLYWGFFYESIDFLGKKFGEIKNKFLNETLKQDPVEYRSRLIKRRCLDETTTLLGPAVTFFYIQQQFSKDEIIHAAQIYDEIKTIFHDNLASYNWLDDETRSVIKNKIEKIKLRLGYPDFMSNITALNEFYSNLELEDNTYFENVMKIRKLKQLHEYMKFTKGTDSNYDWTFSIKSFDPGFFYDFTENQIIAPGCSLKFPAHHKQFPKSVIYANTGMSLGHELTHSFDGDVPYYDENGNSVSWATPKVKKSFDEKRQCFIDHFNQYSMYNVSLNLTDMSAGEVISDAGGIGFAYKALKNWLENSSDEEKKQEILPGLEFLTPEKLFFVSYAQFWCKEFTEEFYEKWLDRYAHPPGNFRVMGLYRNFDEFSKVFECSKDSYMNLKNKCKIW